MPAIKPIHFSRFARIEMDGWVHDRTKGDHLIYVKPGFKRPVVIPRWEKVPVFIILNNLRTAGITRDRYFELLAQT
jgi:predicted RNA binding protein YcfA (HicA-like mRNA interferase family)